MAKTKATVKHVSRITHVRDLRHIVVSRDRYGNRVWLTKEGTWTSDYAERDSWSSSGNARVSAREFGIKDPEIVLES